MKIEHTKETWEAIRKKEIKIEFFELCQLKQRPVTKTYSKFVGQQKERDEMIIFFF